MFEQIILFSYNHDKSILKLIENYKNRKRILEKKHMSLISFYECIQNIRNDWHK